MKGESPEKCHNLEISYLCLSWSVLLDRVFTCVMVHGVAEVKLKEAGKDAPPKPLEGAQPWPHLDFRLLAPRTVREEGSVV